MVDFVPSVWKAQGEVIAGSADDFYRSAHNVIISKVLTARTASPLETELVAGDALCHNPWHHLIAGGYEGLTSVGSRMVATGSDYAATEEQAADNRFWQ